MQFTNLCIIVSIRTCMYVCVWERERERELMKGTANKQAHFYGISSKALSYSCTVQRGVWPWCVERSSWPALASNGADERCNPKWLQKQRYQTVEPFKQHKKGEECSNAAQVPQEGQTGDALQQNGWQWWCPTKAYWKSHPPGSIGQESALPAAFQNAWLKGSWTKPSQILSLSLAQDRAFITTYHQIW